MVELKIFSNIRQIWQTRGSQYSNGHSRFTQFLLSWCPPQSILRSILIEQDSRRIAYFGCLNLSFMMVQFFYGFNGKSLGLITDSIHMFFDCAGLAVGLAAAVMRKWPPSVSFPYGYGKVESLSGFANGILLLLVSVEIIFDAIGRLQNGTELHRVNELLVVSILGFLVNLVGLTSFGHAHHHHGHSHGHSHKKEKKTTIDRDSALSNSNSLSPAYNHHHHHHHHQDHDPDHNSISSHSHDKDHNHPHHDDNMEGIFLHIMADALGSVAVIFSTALTRYTGWNGWDPIASCLISMLIFASAIPLVKRSAWKLLLAMPNRIEWQVRQALGGLGNIPGVRGYRYCRFWMKDEIEMHGHESEDDCKNHSHHHTNVSHENKTSSVERERIENHTHDHQKNQNHKPYDNYRRHRQISNIYGYGDEVHKGYDFDRDRRKNHTYLRVGDSSHDDDGWGGGGGGDGKRSVSDTVELLGQKKSPPEMMIPRISRHTRSRIMNPLMNMQELGRSQLSVTNDHGSRSPNAHDRYRAAPAPSVDGGGGGSHSAGSRDDGGTTTRTTYNRTPTTPNNPCTIINKPPVIVYGVIHVLAASSAALEDVRKRCHDFLDQQGMDVIVHVEVEGDANQCWCSAVE